MSDLAVSSRERIRVPGGIRRAFLEHLPMAGVIFAYMTTTLAVAYAYGLEAFFSLSLYSKVVGIALLVSGVVIFLGFILWMPIIGRERRPLTRIIRTMGAFLKSPYRVASAVIIITTMPFFLSSFTSFKSMIALLHPFRFDELFMHLDKILTFGVHPWQVTHFVFGSSVGTVGLNFFYAIWFFAMWGFVLWYTFAWQDRRARLQFLSAFLLCWMIIGSFTALAFSSAGPVYFGAVTGLEDPYQPLMAKLYAIKAGFSEEEFWDVWALGVQEKLWDKFAASEVGVGSGVSALPSMHVSVAVLMALAAWQRNRILGWLMTANAALILIGSVHLAWHYAVDGYVAAIMTYGVWKLADRFALFSCRFADRRMAEAG